MSILNAPPLGPPTGDDDPTYRALVREWRVGLVQWLRENISPLASHPIGSVYISVLATSPATLFGGSWNAIATGRVLVGYDAGDSDFDTAKKESGSKAHTLTVAEMPAHTHTIEGQLAAATGTTRRQLTAVASSNQTSQSTGGDVPHNNVQPSYTVFMWERVA